MRIADSVYFISGGASGLGEAAARRLAANGAAGVVISDLNLEAAQKLASELGDVALAVRADRTALAIDNGSRARNLT